MLSWQLPPPLPPTREMASQYLKRLEAPTRERQTTSNILQSSESSNFGWEGVVYQVCMSMSPTMSDLSLCVFVSFRPSPCGENQDQGTNPWPDPPWRMSKRVLLDNSGFECLRVRPGCRNPPHRSTSDGDAQRRGSLRGGYYLLSTEKVPAFFVPHIFGFPHSLRIRTALKCKAKGMSF